MRKFGALLILALVSAIAQQSPPPDNSNSPATPAPGSGDYYCPMDKDVRSDKPGVCPRCGMKLAVGIPDETEYPMELKLKPVVFHAGQSVQLDFRINDPKTHKPVDHFEIVHEKPFHLFVVSQDLQYFLHDHPDPQPDGSFVYNEKFPKPGMYRVVGDYFPTNGTPQLTARTVIVPGAPGEEVSLAPPKLHPELGISHGENADVELTMEPPQPLAGFKTLLFFKLKQADGLEKYIGAWAHMLAASDDLIDVIHDHPFLADGGPQMQFNIIFPREHVYKIWVQFQRKGVINTVSFTVPVQELK